MNMTYKKGFLTLPAAVIVAGALIAVALIWINKPKKEAAQLTAPAVTNTTIAPVTAADHILGNPNAPVKLVEYSDLSCPFCKLFNPTMERVIAEYGPSGKVAWVYRQFPLFKSVNDIVPHPNSLAQAEALECAAQLGGNSAFFAFEKKWFSIFPEEAAGRPAAEDRRVIDAVAKDVGLDAASFKECLASGRFQPKIEKAYNEGLAAGITGTPYTVLITPSGTKIPFVGIQPYATLRTTIDALLTSLATTTDIKN